MTNISSNAVDPGSYTIRIGDSEITYKFALGGVYSVLATASNASNYVSLPVQRSTLKPGFEPKTFGMLYHFS